MNILNDEVIAKYEPEVFKCINPDNLEKIIIFLENENVDCIDEIITDYLDLFMIEYDEFVKRFNHLNQVYEEELGFKINEDISILDELMCFKN